MDCSYCDDPIEAGQETVQEHYEGSPWCEEQRLGGPKCPHLAHYNCAEDAWTRWQEEGVRARYSA